MPNVEKNDEAAKRNRPSRCHFGIWKFTMGDIYSHPKSSNNWRTSLVPAPAVIPAPKAYINAVAVKGFVVELWAVKNSAKSHPPRIGDRCAYGS